MAIAALLAVTTAVAAAGSVMQGERSREAADNQAKQLEMQSRQEQQAAGAQISSDDYKSQQVLGRITAGAGAAGVTEEGSPTVASNRSFEEAQINDMYTRYSGRLAAVKDLYAADTARYEGGQAQTAGFIKAGQTVLNAPIQYYSLTRGARSGGFTGGSTQDPNNTGAGLGLSGSPY